MCYYELMSRMNPLYSKRYYIITLCGEPVAVLVSTPIETIIAASTLWGCGKISQWMYNRLRNRQKFTNKNPEPDKKNTIMSLAAAGMIVDSLLDELTKNNPDVVKIQNYIYILKSI